MTDTALYADVVLPATTFLEGYDFARGVRPDQPAARPAGDRSRSAKRARTPTCSASSDARSDLREDDEPDGRARRDARRARHAARHDRRRRCATGARRRRRSAAARYSSSTCFRRTPDGKVDLFPAALDAEAPAGLYGYQPDPATERVSRWR